MLYELRIIATSLVNHDNMQRIELDYHAKKTCHLYLNVYYNKDLIVGGIDVAFTSGKSKAYILLPVQNKTFDAEWKFFDLNGQEVYFSIAKWETPRDWTIYFMISSHTDIGLHNSQYVQRANSVKFIDKAITLTEQTRDGSDDERYKYIMEGTWFWNNYPMDKGKNKAKKVVEEYIKKGDLGVCCGVAGNVMQTFGLEEMCRFANERKKLEKEWGIKSQTMSMIDNNGLPLSIIQPLTDAGIKNIIFSPNHWHPIPSSIWQRNLEDDTYPWNPDAGGGGSRIDFRFDSELPMVFFWEDDFNNRMLVLGSTQYDNSGVPFGIFNKPQPALINSENDYIPYAEIKTARTLNKMEKKYDFNVYLLPCYSDDQEPNLWMRNKIKEWNSKWKYPHFSIIGNPDIPFNVLREKFYDKIPVVKGDITGAWYQLHPSVADVSTKKYQVDKLLPTAEKYCTVASTLDKKYLYPKTGFDRAYNHLLYNDEHSYGGSTYRGRKVHETWLQHRDWVEKAYDFAVCEKNRALSRIANKINCKTDSVVAFNPTNKNRLECVKIDDGKKYKIVTLPKFGYKVIDKESFDKNQCVKKFVKSTPIIENEFYKIVFSNNGAINSIYDKELEKEILDIKNEYKFNEFIYTKDNHQSFTAQNGGAKFEIINDCEGITVKVKTKLDALDAGIEQRITLSSLEKKILISNDIYHARDMYNFTIKKAYKRYLYIAFPFAVNGAKRLCHLNGAVMEYAKGVTGHGTDVYAAMHDWCVAENDEYGVALMAKETQLIEFDHIHKDKSDFGNVGEGSQTFCYVANDWLQMHVSGGDDLNFNFNYEVTSYRGDHESANIKWRAEKFNTEIDLVNISAQKGVLPNNEYTFFNFDTTSRFITLKPADDGDGIIARFYGKEKEECVHTDNVERVTVDESKTDRFARNGFYTYRLKGHKIKKEKLKKVVTGVDKPLPIGSHYTGLIDKPKATNGENDGQIYLIWGKNRERNLSHYELYRSETPEFKACKKTFVSCVYPEPFVIARYSDEGLKINTRYYYKVRAVNKNGVKGELSNVFFAKTKEHLE